MEIFSDKYNRGLKWSTKHCNIFIAIIILMYGFIFSSISTKAYTVYSSEYNTLTDVVEHYNLLNVPTYMYNYNYYVVNIYAGVINICFSNSKFQVLQDNSVFTIDDIDYTSFNGSNYVKFNLITGAYIEQKFSNSIMANVSDANYLIFSNSEINCNNLLFYKTYGQPTPIPYTYLYKSSIPNIKDLKIQKQSLYRTDWGLVIGESSHKYDVTWLKEEPEDYTLEILMKSAFDEKFKWYDYQSWDKPYYVDSFIMENSQKFSFDMNVLSSIILHKCWTDTDTGSYLGIPPTEIYIRYVNKNEIIRKIEYGNWTKFDLLSGAKGVIEVKKNTVLTTEVVNSVTGETEIIDTIVEGTPTEYMNTSTGEYVSEEESLEGAMFDMENGLQSATDTIQNVGSWVGQVPDLVGTIFTFLPIEIVSMIGLGIVLIIVLRVVGR